MQDPRGGLGGELREIAPFRGGFRRGYRRGGHRRERGIGAGRSDGVRSRRRVRNRTSSTRTTVPSAHPLSSRDVRFSSGHRFPRPPLPPRPALCFGSIPPTPRRFAGFSPRPLSVHVRSAAPSGPSSPRASLARSRTFPPRSPASNRISLFPETRVFSPPPRPLLRGALAERHVRRRLPATLAKRSRVPLILRHVHLHLRLSLRRSLRRRLGRLRGRLLRIRIVIPRTLVVVAVVEVEVFLEHLLALAL